MLTPQDLQEVSFEKAKIGGYVMKSVDEFLEPLMDDYVTLYKENAVLKSKMRLLVERLEEYRANEAAMKEEMEAARKSSEQMIAEAQARSDELLRKAQADAQARSRDIDSAAAAEQERLRRIKASTAEFVSAVEAQLAKQQQSLEMLKKMDLPTEQQPSPNTRRAYDYESEQDPPKVNAEEIAAQIEQNVANITGDTPRPPQDPMAATRVMPPIDLDERTTAKFANLKFGKNYQM